MTTKPIKHRRTETGTAVRVSNGRSTYHIGAEIGRGGFAVVFQALNVETGDFVAVKRFPLSTVDEESLASIESEIELMKKLHHDNIVQYVDTIRSDEYLYIALEFMENGSLSNVIKKFGTVPEPLTAIYVAQVLRGLKYLHDQGVLHRDIKGANILTTKDGLVKLADFGVAMKLDSKADEQDVVGTPYWMAPEIVEMSTPTAACDIWSVGCTVVELLTGKPPYYDLAPMAALFRIVQDDHPPLPDGISEALRDFLLQCFQKEPMMRKGAEELLRHAWLQNPANKQSKTTVPTTLDLEGVDDGAGTLRAGNHPRPAARPGRPGKAGAKAVAPVKAPPQRRLPASKSSVSQLEDDDENWDDADFPVDDDVPTISPTRKLVPQAKSPPKLTPKLAPKLAPKLGGHHSTPTVADLAAFLEDDAPAPIVKAQVTPTRKIGSVLTRFREEEETFEEDFDLETGSFDDAAQDADTLRERMQHNVDLEEDDDFLDIQFEETDFQQNENKDVHMRRSKDILSLMASITPEAGDIEITHACTTLLDMFENHPDQKEHLVTHHGVLPIVEMLEVRSVTVLPEILRVVNKVILDNKRAQEQLSLVGVIPIMIRLIEGGTTVDNIRIEASKFVQQLCASAGLTLQMLIGAGGLQALVKVMMLSANIESGPQARELSRIATDCILQVFVVQSSRTRDFCRLFVKFGLLSPLVQAFQQMLNISKLSDRADDWRETHRIANIIAHFSRSDAMVTERMAQEGLIAVLVGALQDPKLTTTTKSSPQRQPRHTRALSVNWMQAVPLPAPYVELMETLLKCVKNISMEPSALEALESAGAIPALIPIMSGPMGDRAMIHIMPCMFNLCRISKRRQEQAAAAGLIPHLQRLINDDSHLKQFALPVICDLAHASQLARTKLWENNGVKFYLNLLQENYWQTFALNSLAIWLASDAIRVEGLLIQPANLSQVVEFFRAASAQTISNVHKPFLDMMSKSTKLSKALGGSGLFVESLLSRMRSSEAIVLRSLLKMLQLLHQCHPNPRQLVLDFNLYPIVQTFEQDKSQVLVYQMATRLLREFHQTTLA